MNIIYGLLAGFLLVFSTGCSMWDIRDRNSIQTPIPSRENKIDRQQSQSTAKNDPGIESREV